MRVGKIAHQAVELAPILLLAAISLAAIVVSIFPPTVQPPARHSLSGPAQRAVVLPVILSAYATIDRGVNHLLAVSNVAREWGSYGVMGDVYPAAAKLPVVGRMILPEPEKLLSVHPDALFVPKQQSEVLRKLGMPGLVEVSFMPRDARKSRFGVWRLIGATTGNAERVMALMRWDAQQREELQRLLGSFHGRPPRVLLVHAGKGQWSVPGGYYAMGSNIAEAGGVNLATSFKLSGLINLEQILALDPEILLLDPNVMMSPYASNHDVTPEEIYKMPECQVLQAVKNRRVYMLPQHSYTNESIEDPLILSWMAEVFYPEQAPHRLRGVYREAYRQIYGFNISDEEIDRALFLKENRGSAGYERFHGIWINRQ